MIRILTADAPEAITITLDGHLAGESVDAVEICTHQAIGQRRPVNLFLREVSAIDERGRALLCRLAEKGVDLSAAGIYCSYIIAGIRRETSERRDGRGSLSGTPVIRRA